MSKDDYTTAVRLMANHRQVCNCGEAYADAKPSDGDGMVYSTCPGGRQANILRTKYEMAAALLALYRAAGGTEADTPIVKPWGRK